SRIVRVEVLSRARRLSAARQDRVLSAHAAGARAAGARGAGLDATTWVPRAEARRAHARVCARASGAGRGGHGTRSDVLESDGAALSRRLHDVGGSTPPARVSARWRHGPLVRPNESVGGARRSGLARSSSLGPSVRAPLLERDYRLLRTRV